MSGLPRTWATTQLEAALSPLMTLVDHVAGPVQIFSLRQAARYRNPCPACVRRSMGRTTILQPRACPLHCTGWTSAQLTIEYNESGDLETYCSIGVQ